MVPAAATAASAASARSIAVSVPAYPVSLNPGQTAAIPIRVLNPSASSVTVTVKGEGVKLGNNGTTTFTGEPDPLWASRTSYPHGALSILGQHYVDLSITVHMPAQISPDLYYIGFLVTPVPTAAGQVVVINQIGAFLTVDVAGPRARSLAADLTTKGFNWGPIHLSWLVVGTEVAGKLTVENTGASSVLFFGENDVTSSPISGSPSQQRISRSLLPIRRSRWFAVTAAPAFPIDVVTMSDVVTYPDRTGTGTLDIVLTRSMLVINPWVLVVLIAIVLLIVGWRVRARAKRSRLSRSVPMRRAA